MGNTQAAVQQEKIKAERRRRTRKRCKGERVYVWHNAQLDVNAPPAKEIPRPVLLEELEGKTITQIWAGFVYACATAEGDLHILKIPLKDPTSNNTAPLDPEVFGVVQTLSGNVASFDGACLNGSHLAAITNDGQVAVWGRGTEGEIGNGTWQDARVPTLAYVPGTYRPSFPFDRFWTKQSVVSLSCGDGHMIALRSDGEVFVWGYNVARQCGPETSDIRYPRPLSDWWTLPSEDGGVVQVSAGYCKNYLLTSTGAVFGWGRNREAELGVGECPLATVRMPTRLDLPPCRFINAGPHNCGAITFTEDIYTWGVNTAGALGLGTNLRVVSVPSPVEIEDFENVHKRDLALGTVNSVVVLESGALYVTGQVEDWRGNVFTFVKELAEEHVVRASCDAVSIMVLCGGEEVMSLKELCIEHVKERRRELGPQLDRLPVEIKRAILSD